MNSHRSDTLTNPEANEQHFKALADRFKLLSDPSRLRILSALCQQEYNVTEICELTGLNQANVSKHLQLLKYAGVVRCNRVGICRYYRVIDRDLLDLCSKPLAEFKELPQIETLGEDHCVEKTSSNQTNSMGTQPSTDSRCCAWTTGDRPGPTPSRGIGQGSTID